MIKLFRGEHTWLSNMILVDVKYNGIEYPSVEHAYMSAKSDDMVWKSRCADKQIPPKQIKKESKNIILRDDWDDVKIDVMRECLKEKYNQEPFKNLLINTKNQDLIEGNWWNDLEWGVDIVTGKGENNLGKLIMEIRDNINNGTK